jgi:hypothetical protein
MGETKFLLIFLFSLAILSNSIIFNAPFIIDIELLT